MKESKLLENLKNPRLYGNDIKKVKILQTHISYVVLTGEYAYKIKKPVNFGFLDFSTLDKRKYFCNEELRLNRRLCPDIYIDIVQFTKKDKNLQINGDGKVVEYALKMKEFSQKNIMTNLLKQEKIDEDIIDKICYILTDFYKRSEHSEEINKYGLVETVKKNTDENFQQTESVIDVTIKKEIFDFIKSNTDNFLEQKEGLFKNRIVNNHICDCHGDLHSGNIVVSEKEVCIFDCIEFNKRFRYSDVSSDIAFLAMDLDYQGYPYLSSYFIKKYIEESKDAKISSLLNFYKCYRAYVRGKVIGFRLDEQNIDKNEILQIKNSAKKYFDLSYYYSKLCSTSFKKMKPLLFITSGLTGTGKTTIANKISVDYNARIISTDSVRKDLEGINKFERHHDAYNTGLYSPEKMLLTYDKIFEKAEKCVKEGQNVILDATFKNKELRDKAKDIAILNKSKFLILYCTCPEDLVKKYLENRVKKKSISDGRWEIYLKQKDSFEPVKSKDNIIEIDISRKSFDYQIDVFNQIFKKISED
jgi:aminoglycoside phosphotransferase family enzyme/predicted kinase